MARSCTFDLRIRFRGGDLRTGVEWDQNCTPHCHQRPERWGRIRMGDDSRCPLLSRAGRCSLQETLGSDALPQTCASYPRSLSRRHDGHYELGAFFSCPEAARLALLAEDAFTQDPLTLPHSPRINLDQTIDQTGPWFTLIDEVRPALYALGRDRPLAARLWLLSRLAAASVAHFNRPAADPAPIRALLVRFSDPAHQEALLAEQPAAPRAEFVEIFTEQLRFLAEGNPSHYARPRRLLWRALQRPPTPWAPLEAALAGPLDRYLAHHLLARWYTESADLSQHTTHLLIKLAVLRVLLTRRAPEQSLEDALIDAVYAVDRLIEHDAWILSCRAALRRCGGSHFDLLGDLLTFSA